MRMYGKQRRSRTAIPALPEAEKAVQAYLRGLSSGSRRTVAQSLDVVAVALSGKDQATALAIAWHRLDRAGVETARSKLAKGYLPATVNKMLSCVRGVLRACRDLGLMSEEQFTAVSRVSNVPMVYHPDPSEVRLASLDEVKALLRTCKADSSPAGRRDAALLAVLLSSGLRRAEAAAFDLDDYCSSSRALRIRSASGERDRTLILKDRPVRLIDVWLDERGGEPGPLLLPVNKSGVVVHRQLTDQAIYDIIRRLAVRAQVPHITTRALRRTFVATLIARGLPLERVQQIAGHASWVTTEAYESLAQELFDRSDQLPELFVNVQRSPLTAIEEGGPR